MKRRNSVRIGIPSERVGFDVEGRWQWILQIIDQFGIELSAEVIGEMGLTFHGLYNVGMTEHIPDHRGAHRHTPIDTCLDLGCRFTEENEPVPEPVRPLDEREAIPTVDQIEVEGKTGLENRYVRK